MGYKERLLFRLINILSISLLLFSCLAFGIELYPVSPINGINYSTRAISFNVSLSDEASYCGLSISGAPNITMAAFNSTYYNYTNSSMAEGQYNAVFSCNDSLGNWNSTQQIYFSVDTVFPLLSAVSPSSKAYNSDTINFSVGISEPAGWCGFSLDSEGNVSMSAYNSTFFNYTKSGLSEGGHAIVYSCNDSAGNMNMTSPVEFSVDTVKPGIAIVSPLNQTYLLPSSARSMDFNVSLNESGSFCAFSINNGGNVTMTAFNATYYNYTNRSMSDGSYAIIFSCNDTAGNMNSTGQLTFTVSINKPPVINSHSQSPALPIQYDAVQILANVTDLTSDILWVNFSVGAPNGTLVISNTNASSHTGDLWQSDSFNLSSPGPWTWNISASDGLDIASATGSYELPSTIVFYGNVSGKITLADSSGLTVMEWQVSNISGSKVYAADSDSSISFLSLVALGRTALGQYDSTDFAEADSLLNSSVFVDSLNNTYLINSQPVMLLNLEVFGKNVSNVSVTNSTNSSNFRTGALWDSSDDVHNDGYDSTDKEDLIFVTLVNPSQQGKYGQYDYELRVPALLGLYKGGSSHMISLYAEIK